MPAVKKTYRNESTLFRMLEQAVAVSGSVSLAVIAKSAAIIFEQKLYCSS